jgi:hypothetical protein
MNKGGIFLPDRLEEVPASEATAPGMMPPVEKPKEM